MKALILWWIFLFCLLAGVNSVRAEPVDARYCYQYIHEIPRWKDGSIKRSDKVLQDFKKIHPCPVTAQTIGACPGWQINHIIPLAVGGCDSIINLQWLPDAVKTCPGTICIDRFERRIYDQGFGK